MRALQGEGGRAARTTSASASTNSTASTSATDIGNSCAPGASMYLALTATVMALVKVLMSRRDCRRQEDGTLPMSSDSESMPSAQSESELGVAGESVSASNFVSPWSSMTLREMLGVARSLKFKAWITVFAAGNVVIRIGHRDRFRNVQSCRFETLLRLCADVLASLTIVAFLLVGLVSMLWVVGSIATADLPVSIPIGTLQCSLTRCCLSNATEDGACTYCTRTCL